MYYLMNAGLYNSPVPMGGREVSKVVQSIVSLRYYAEIELAAGKVVGDGKLGV